MRSRMVPCAAVAAFVVLGGACSSDGPSTPGQGGAGRQPGPSAGETGGGNEGAAGSSTPSGGKAGASGQSAGETGGNGGAVQPSGSGGTKETGGSTGSGGKTGTGGRDGGSATAGRSGPEGGPGKGGSAGKEAPTDSGSGPIAPSDAGATPGCGAATVEPACSTKGSPCSIDVGGTARTFYVQLPKNYNAAKPYPVFFQYHPWGGSADGAMTMYNLNSAIPDAIYVSPQGLPSGSNNSPGWENTNGRDMAFTKAMISKVEEAYCVDTTRIFSLGFSYGGMMSYAIGCEMGDVFRAIAPMSGALYSGCKNGTHAIAMWGSHGTSDGVVPIANGRQGRDEILKRNHCGTETTPVEPSPCVSYKGCDEGYPVTWCEFDGDHGMPSFERTAVPAFFKQYL